jgi:aspartate carbamoyltransferase catalytic subunit
VDAQSTSLKKGETMEDTLLNLRELGVGTFVIRTSETGSLEALRSVDGVSLVNAGDGVGEHPTQALLDLATLVAHLGRGNLKKLKGLKLGILGDLRRSRVARSWSFLAPLVGIDLCVISPADWKPDWLGALSWTDQKTKALKNLDVLMALRVQKERMSPEDSGVEKFIRNFRVSPKDLSSDAMLMHPGPVNWGVELDVLLKKDERSLILDQVRMGLAVRSVVLDEIS